jgi:uncharacterized protein
VSPDSTETARRFVLGRQGLWPGRRWEGRRGVEAAIRYIDSLQVDSLDVVGRHHDLALWGRVNGYRVEHLQHALYRARNLFEWGGNVQIRPVEELPFLRVVMARKVAEERWRRFARSNAALVARVAREVEQAGPLGARELVELGGAKLQNYRARTDSGLALYYLWLKGDVMVASRRSGEKLFDLTPRLYPQAGPEVSVEAAEDHLILRTLRDLGLATSPEWLRHAQTRIGRTMLRHEWAERVRRWSRSGAIEEIEVDGWSGRLWLVAEAARDLASLRDGEVPPEWRPRTTTTEEEALLVAPLELATARGRAAEFFDFEFVWEVYKPPSARRWGYYTLPVLFGDRLRARIDLKFDRPTGTLRVLGFWPEEPSLRRDRAFGSALGRALARLADFHRAAVVDLAGLHSPSMRRGVEAAIRESRESASAPEPTGPRGPPRRGTPGRTR